MRLSAVRAVLALAAVLSIGGCGGGLKAADLFIVTRTSSSPPARLTVLVDEEGNVTCNGGPSHRISDPQLVQARAIQEEIAKAASAGLSLAPRPGSVFSYALRDENGTVRFSDNSADQPQVLRELALWVLQVSQQHCHVAQ